MTDDIPPLQRGPDGNRYLVPPRKVENERPVMAWLVLAGLTVAVIVAGYGLVCRLIQ